MSNANYSQISNVPSQSRSLNTSALTVAGPVVAASVQSEVVASVTHPVFLPSGETIQKVTLYSDGDNAWWGVNAVSMVTTPGGSTVFEWPVDVNIVGARLVVADTKNLIDNALTVNVNAGSVFNGAPIANINAEGVVVSAFGANVDMGGSGALQIVPASLGDPVLLQSIGGTPTQGALVLDLYYY